MGQQGRGLKVNLDQRHSAIKIVTEATQKGCRLSKACDALSLQERTIQRWKLNPDGDLRRGPNKAPANKLTDIEKKKIILISSSKEFMDLSPSKIVPTLADRGEYIASESSFYRIFKEAEMLCHRGRVQQRRTQRPKGLKATGSNQVYSWDITYLMSAVRGKYFYLYVFMDLFSRKIVGWKVYESESADYSSKLLREICEKENIKMNQLQVHSDNGGPMKGATMLATMQWLGVVPSFSRPSVSNDNPFSESLFRTLKYCPQYPSKPFEDIEGARRWVNEFVNWYNNIHIHSGIKYVTPSSKHAGKDIEILNKRREVYTRAREKNPTRWSKEIRDWQPIRSVKLNCLHDENNSCKVDVS